MYLPFMHSESTLIHQQAKQLSNHPEMASNYEFELKHDAIIERFGRYPHRSAILKRQSIDEEIQFLKLPNSSF